MNPCLPRKLSFRLSLVVLTIIFSPSIANAANRADSGPATTQGTILVTTVDDHDDGACTPQDCTLREAINAANGVSGEDTVMFQAGVTGTIVLQSTLGPVTIHDSPKIEGPGARGLAVSGNGAVEVFHFASGTNTVSGLTIRDGAAVGTEGVGACVRVAAFSMSRH